MHVGKGIFNEGLFQLGETRPYALDGHHVSMYLIRVIMASDGVVDEPVIRLQLPHAHPHRSLLLESQLLHSCPLSPHATQLLLEGAYLLHL
jgi:hypothetical protein